MDFSDDITTIAIELPASWRNMIYCMIAFAAGLFLAYSLVLWRCARVSRKSKIWFSALFATAFAASLATIFLENIFY